jgi:hypothetical protein
MTAHSIPDRVVTVISDGFVLEVACTDDRFDAVVAGLQGFLVALDVEVAVMTMESGERLAAEEFEAELVRRSVVLN